MFLRILNPSISLIQLYRVNLSLQSGCFFKERSFNASLKVLINVASCVFPSETFYCLESREMFRVYFSKVK